MSDATLQESPVEFENRMLRMVEETRKFVAEQHKLAAEQRKLDAENKKMESEQRKLDAEALKFGRERWLAPVVALAAAVGAFSGILVSLVRLRG